jgi:hypothetical protein
VASTPPALAVIFWQPARSGIRFGDVEALVVALGGEVREREGSRVVFALKGTRRYLHRPHPGRDARRYQVEEIRDWLTEMEITP